MYISTISSLLFTKELLILPTRVKPKLSHKCIEAILVETTELNCIALKPHSLEILIECSPNILPIPFPRNSFLMA